MFRKKIGTCGSIVTLCVISLVFFILENPTKVPSPTPTRGDILRCNVTSPPMLPLQNYTQNQLLEEQKMYRYMPFDLLMFPPTLQVQKWMSQTVGAWPKMEAIAIHNHYWQYVNLHNQTIYLLSASYDCRASQKIVSIVLGAKLINQVPPFFCRMWFKGKDEPQYTKVDFAPYLNSEEVRESPLPQPYGQIYLTHIASCKLDPKMGYRAPVAVSVVQSYATESTNLLKVFNSGRLPKKRRGIGMCLKPLFYPFEDKSTEIIEWLETVFALGARKAHVHYLALAPSNLRVLQYYEGLGKIELLPITWPGEMPMTPHAQTQYIKHIPRLTGGLDRYIYNDCFRQNMYNYEFIPLLDTDEIVMPDHAKNWPELFKEIASLSHMRVRQIDCMDFPHHYFFEHNTKGINKSHAGYHRILDSNLRSVADLADRQRKVIFNTRTALRVFNHYPIDCIHGECKNCITVPQSVARLNHYRASCLRIWIVTPEICQDMHTNVTEDNRINVLRETILEGIQRTLHALSF